MTRPARKMKPSGIPWIGDVPTDWEICKLKFVVNAFTGNSIKDEEKDFYSSFPLESSHPYIATKDIDKITGRINYESGLRTLKRDTLFKLAPKYSTLLCVEGGSAGEKIAFTEQDVSFVNKLCCFYTSSINKKYLFYFLSSSAFKECFKSFISGLIGGVPVSVFKNFNISIPPTETQKKIAEFLDEKCAEIDALIAIEEKMIAELKSYKQSVITEAVTRGVPAAENAARPLKDSGIPWLGSVPAHWEILPLKRLCKMKAGENLTSLEIEKEGEFPVYGGNGLRGFYKKYNCSGEYVLVGRQGALAGNIHKVCGCFWATDHALITRCSRLTSIPYISYLLEAMNLNQYALQTAAQPGLSVGLVQSLLTTVPPLSEQQKIVIFLDSENQKVDSMISLKQEKIATLQNYKKSIIFEYVTGKEFI